MAKKKKKTEKDLFENFEVEPVKENESETESVSSKTEADSSEVIPEVDEDVQPEVEDEPSSEDVPLDDMELSADDLLDDVRRSLIEENEVAEESKKPSLWQKIGFGSRKKKDDDEVSADVEDTVASDDVYVEDAVEPEDDAVESIDDLIEILESEVDDKISSDADIVSSEVHDEQVEPEVEVEKVPVEELKKRAFQSSKPDDKDEDFSEVRAVALEGGEEVFVEVEVKAEDPVEDRLKSFENALRPYRRYIYFGMAFIGIVVIIATSALLINAVWPEETPAPGVPTEVLPYPVVLNIPGPLSFNLGRGTLEDGRWDPRSPEWLEGTEICRWVAIPHSRQLEAVVRTLTRDDKFEIVMSNNDRWSYDVYSITQMTLEDMQKVSANTPCLLLVLADVNTDTRWVVTTYP